MVLTAKSAVVSATDSFMDLATAKFETVRSFRPFMDPANLRANAYDSDDGYTGSPPTTFR